MAFGTSTRKDKTMNHYHYLAVSCANETKRDISFFPEREDDIIFHASQAAHYARIYLRTKKAAETRKRQHIYCVASEAH